jgi:glycosyltransferase involved in cell wall biosynthesis
MKVVLATQTYAPVIGGEERHVQNLAGWLAGHGHDVHLPTQAPDGPMSADVDDRDIHIQGSGVQARRDPRALSSPPDGPGRQILGER